MFLPYVRFVVSFLPNGCRPEHFRRNLNTSAAVWFQKIGCLLQKITNYRWQQQVVPATLHQLLSTWDTGDLKVSKKEVWKPVSGARCWQPHRCACSLTTLVRLLLEKVCLLSTTMEALKAAWVFVRFQMLHIWGFHPKTQQCVFYNPVLWACLCGRENRTLQF